MSNPLVAHGRILVCDVSSSDEFVGGSAVVSDNLCVKPRRFNCPPQILLNSAVADNLGALALTL